MYEGPIIEISETHLHVYRLVVDGEVIGKYQSVIDAALAVEKLMKEREDSK